MEFYCSLPQDINDPFDSKCIFDNCGSESDFRMHYAICLNKQQPGLSEAEKQQKIDAFIKSKKWQDNQFRDDLFKNFSDKTSELFSKMGMVCFSKCKDNILMWSHYADGHRGFCLEFDRLLLQEKCNALVEDIKYKLPTFTDFMKNINEINYIPSKILLSKSGHWEYEQEVRMIIFLGSDMQVLGLRGRFMSFPPEALTGVIFGCLMTDEDKTTIRNMLSNKIKTTRFYEAKKINNTYELDISPIQ